MAVAGYLVAALVLFPAPLLPNEREIPRVLGLTGAAAERELEREGFVVEMADREPHLAAAAGVVTWQDPPPGVVAPRGSVVALTLSAGPPRVAVPDVAGLELSFARRLLFGAGLRVEAVDSVSSGLPPGVAVGTTPAARDSLPAGASVTIHVAKERS